MNKLPLEGIRVADFTQVAQGPFATLLLAQMGAEVIKIETAGRVEGPRDPLAGAGRNFSKKSLTLNLKVPQGLEALKELVKVSDIVMENYATGVMERLGVGYEDLRKVKPDIVMLSSQGLGRTGDLRNAVSYYAEVQNFAGLSHLAGYKDGKMGTVQSIWGDHLTAMLLIFAVLAALRHRRETGEGQYIQVCMADNIIASIPEAVLDYVVNGRDEGPQENADASFTPHGAYMSQGLDKWIAIAVTNDEEWNAFCQATGHPEWAKDERFADPLSRWHNHAELDKLVTQWTMEHTDYEAMQILQAAGVPAGPTLDGAGVADDPHLHERGLYVQIGERDDGKPNMHVGQPWHLSDVPEPVYKPVPVMGADNDYVLRELLGMSEEKIDELRANGVFD